MERDATAFGWWTWCSWHNGTWRSALLRELVSRPAVDHVVVPPVDDQVVVLVTRGGKRIESGPARSVSRATYGPGTVAHTAPGRTGEFSWRCLDGTTQRALHLYIPAVVMHTTAAALWGEDDTDARMPDTLAGHDPTTEQVVRALDVASRGGADDLYAESAITFLAAHLLSRAAGLDIPPAPGREDGRVRAAIAYMRDNLAQPLTLLDLANVVHLSAFHFARVFASTTGMPPRRYLGRLRLEEARRLLQSSTMTVSEVAHRCGFASPQHLSAAMKRSWSLTPSQVRAGHRRG